MSIIQFRHIPPDAVLQDVLCAVYRDLRNPFVMIDTSYNLLAYTENTVQDDPLWNELTSLGKFSHEAVDYFNKANFIQAFADSMNVALMRDASLPYDRVCVKLFDAEGVQIGSIVVVACYNPFGQDDFAQMETACVRISEALQKSCIGQGAKRVYQDDFINDLFEGRINAHNEAFAGLHATLKPHLFLLAIDVSHYEHTLSHLAYFRDLFGELQPEYHYYLYLDNIAALVSAETPCLDINAHLAALNAFFVKYNIFAGVSKSFQSLSDARNRYKQALEALNFCMNAQTSHRISQYDSKIHLLT